jgi:hypothetical protein
MMLVGDDMDADIVAQAIFVEDLVIELRHDIRVAISVRQARPHRLGLFQHLVRHERVRVLAMVPQFHNAASLLPHASGVPYIPQTKPARRVSRRRRQVRARAAVAGSAGAQPDRLDVEVLLDVLQAARQSLGDGGQRAAATDLTSV